jgi:hypothetical protein
VGGADGAKQLIRKPIDFTLRLTALLARPTFHLIRFHGTRIANVMLLAGLVPHGPSPQTRAATETCQCCATPSTRLVCCRVLSALTATLGPRVSLQGRLAPTVLRETSRPRLEAVPSAVEWPVTGRGDQSRGRLANGRFPPAPSLNSWNRPTAVSLSRPSSGRASRRAATRSAASGNSLASRARLSPRLAPIRRAWHYRVLRHASSSHGRQ